MGDLFDDACVRDKHYFGKAATLRALELLRSELTEAEWEELQERDYITVVAPDGAFYHLWAIGGGERRPNYSITELMDGRVLGARGYWPTEPMPVADRLLAFRAILTNPRTYDSFEHGRQGARACSAPLPTDEGEEAIRTEWAKHPWWEEVTRRYRWRPTRGY